MLPYNNQQQLEANEAAELNNGQTEDIVSTPAEKTLQEVKHKNNRRNKNNKKQKLKETEHPCHI